MKALLVRGAGEVALEDVDMPDVPAGYVLVEPLVSGLCGADLEIIAGTIDENYVHYPVVLGHEWVGRLAEHPSNAALVVVEGIVPCAQCDECQRGATNLCRTYDEIDFTRHGALSEFIAVPEHLVHELQSEVSALDAVLTEPMAVVWRALSRAQIREGSRAVW